jgi:hypothetical protein
MTTITDALNSVSARSAAEVAFGAIDHLQKSSPAEQVAGAAFLFHALITKYRLDGREVLAASGRRFTDALGTGRADNTAGDVTRALRTYLDKEV